MGSLLPDLSLSNPVIAAPMAGGATTPELVLAAARSGSLGLLAGGMRPPELLAGDIAKVRLATEAFGVNLFAPNPMSVDRRSFRNYAGEIQSEADAYGLDLRTAEPIEDDDQFRDKIDLLLASPVPVVSFTFAIPDIQTIQQLHRVGSVVIQTVTSTAEARQAEEAGADILVIQSSAAGGHSGTLTSAAHSRCNSAHHASRCRPCPMQPSAHRCRRSFHTRGNRYRTAQRGRRGDGRHSSVAHQRKRNVFYTQGRARRPEPKGNRRHPGLHWAASPGTA